MTDVLFLGAGFSRAISPSMPLLCDLSSELRCRVPDVPGDNVEHWMTYLSQPHPWLSEPQNLRNRALLLELTQDMKDILAEKTRTTIGEYPDCPPWLRNLMRWCHEHRVSVITVNYNTLLESAAQLVSTGKNSRGEDIVLNLGSIYPVPMTPAHMRDSVYPMANMLESFRLFKLHGSINWYFSGASASTGETIFYSDLEKWGDTNRLESVSTRAVSDKVPLIVPPTTEKIAYFQHETIRTIWGLAGQAIQSANRLFCIGYSLPETDLSIRFFLQSNAPKTPVTLYLINSDPKSKEHYEKLLGKSYNVDRRYTGMNNAVEQLAEFLASDIA